MLASWEKNCILNIPGFYFHLPISTYHFNIWSSIDIHKLLSLVLVNESIVMTLICRRSSTTAFKGVHIGPTRIGPSVVIYGHNWERQGRLIIMVIQEDIVFLIQPRRKS